MSLLDRLGDRLGGVVDELARDPAVQRQLEAGREHYDQGAFAQAEETLSAVLQQQSDLPRAWTLLGLSQFAQARYDKARASLERAAEKRPEDFVTAITLAETLLIVGEPEAALARCRRLLRSGRADRAELSKIYALSGRAWLQRQQADQAVRELRKALASSPKRDLALVGVLGQAHYLQGALRSARQQLELAASAQPVDVEVLRCLVETLLALDEVEEARLAALRLVEATPDDAGARLRLAETLLRARRPVEARDVLIRALALSPTLVEVHRLLAQTHVAIGDLEPALRHLQTARELGSEDSVALLRDAVQLRVRQLEDPWQQTALLEQLDTLATELLAVCPSDEVGLAAKGLACAARTPSEGLTLAEQSLAIRESFPGRLAQGVAFAAEEAYAAAAAALRSAAGLESDTTVARQQLELLVRRQVGCFAEEGRSEGLRSTLLGLERFVGVHESLRPLTGVALQMAQDYDRPLLVAVMGEFNSGKSTFVNALIGETIAPMGVTPTTATINLLQYGQRKKVRVVWRDDREELVDWDALASYLAGLSHDQAAAVRWVELLYPAEELLRVNVVDTPGLNSMIPQHERTAREMLRHADVVIWLFSADQAGKQTEQQALGWIEQLGLKTVGVVNKLDRLTPAELARVMAHLQEEFGSLLSGLMPVSARQALSALRDGGEEGLEQSQFPQLRAFLEQELFARSRALKHDVALGRARQLVHDAGQQLQRQIERLVASEGGLIDVAQSTRKRFDELARAERGYLLEGAERVYRRAAEQMLDFIRPRRWMLGEHSTEPADRDFVIALLEGDLDQVCVASQRRIDAALESSRERWMARVREPGAGHQTQDGLVVSETVTRLSSALSTRRQLLEQQVYARFGAFLRGYLRGGWVDRLFEQRLPRIELEVQAIYEALVSEPIELDAELLNPLAAWADGSGKTVATLLGEGLAAVELARWELQTCAVGLLEELATDLK
jgi:tetratricopeptide (TPR) repeat protein